MKRSRKTFVAYVAFILDYGTLRNHLLTQSLNMALLMGWRHFLLHVLVSIIRLLLLFEPEVKLLNVVLHLS